MSARKVAWLVVGLALLIVLPLSLRFVITHQRVSEEVVLPPKGEAAYNPLYALGQALRADGQRVQAAPRLDTSTAALAPGDTVVLLQDPSELGRPAVDALLAWVDRGGHLLLRTPPPVRDGADDDDPEPPLLQALGVYSRGYGKACQPFHVRDDMGHVEFCNGRRFDLDDDAYAAVTHEWGNDQGDDGYVFTRMRRGAGVVDVLADMDFMRNAPEKHLIVETIERAAPDAQQRLRAPAGGLFDRSHRDLARYLLAPNYGKGTLHLVYASRPPSLWAQVIKRGWPVALPLLLALLGWLWARAQRFGSQLPAPADERRSLLEHVRASGELLLRHRQGTRLHGAVRTLFYKRLQARAPLAAQLQGLEQAQAIAALLHWPLDRVQRALAPPTAADLPALKERITLLLQMRRLL